MHGETRSDLRVALRLCSRPCGPSAGARSTACSVKLNGTWQPAGLKVCAPAPIAEATGRLFLRFARFSALLKIAQHLLMSVPSGDGLLSRRSAVLFVQSMNSPSAGPDEPCTCDVTNDASVHGSRGASHDKRELAGSEGKRTGTLQRLNFEATCNRHAQRQVESKDSNGPWLQVSAAVYGSPYAGSSGSHPSQRGRRCQFGVRVHGHGPELGMIGWAWAAKFACMLLLPGLGPAFAVRESSILRACVSGNQE